jgi:enoyl-CoA hydratase/carnithine racemase
MTTLTDYVDAYEFAELERRGNILFLRLHTDDGPLVWAGDIHHRLASLFRDIGDDSENWVLILTGAGDRFIGDVGYGELSESDGRSAWSKNTTITSRAHSSCSRPSSTSTRW